MYCFAHSLMSAVRYCTSSGPSTNLTCLHCGVHYCPLADGPGGVGTEMHRDHRHPVCESVWLQPLRCASSIESGPFMNT